MYITGDEIAELDKYTLNSQRPIFIPESLINSSERKLV